MFALIENYYMNKYNRVFNVGIYVRLSKDDDRGTSQSESIKNQIDFLTRIVIENGWNLIDVYIDDGYTGTNFNRPDFKRMTADIENKRINMVITKDLSRLGREYIETGYYLEKYFPERNIRYIAVNDGIDTFEDSSNNDMSPFKSVINDMYARDTSKKIRTSFMAKRKSGKFIGSFAPYGYVKDPQSKGKLIINEETAYVVKEIYQMFVSGNSLMEIARELDKEAITTPALYKNKNMGQNYLVNSGLWDCSTIKRILTDPTYAGNLTQNKQVKLSYKVKKKTRVPKDNWITIPNTHDPIIDIETFELVQDIFKKRSNPRPLPEKQFHPLAGLIYCGDCGQRMTFTKKKNYATYCICSQYKRYSRCSRHSIQENSLEAYLLEDLQRIAKIALDREKLLNLAQSKTEKPKVSKCEKEITKIENRLLEIKKNIKVLYEDKLRGVLTEDDFKELSQDYIKERETLSARLDVLNKEKHQKQEQDAINESFFETIKGIVDFTIVDRATIVQLVDKIEVFEDKKLNIHYKFRKPF